MFYFTGVNMVCISVFLSISYRDFLVPRRNCNFWLIGCANVFLSVESVYTHTMDDRSFAGQSHDRVVNLLILTTSDGIVNKGAVCRLLKMEYQMCVLNE